MVRIFALALSFLMSGFSAVYAFPQPQLPDTTQYGKVIGHSMHLLATSDPARKRTVRVLVYGQSISEQDWWLSVKADLQERFPNANIIMENRSVGGFASQLLKKIVAFDILSFYPDLVLFHVYGSHIDYETIIRTIRAETSADIGMQTDHYTGADWWSDKMSAEYLPGIASKYGCELLDIRTEWKKYLDANTYQPNVLLRDVVHLNDHGNFVMAELIKPYLYSKPRFAADSFGVFQEYRVGTDVAFVNDTLVLPFEGNRVDLLLRPDGYSASDSVFVSLDGFNPSEFQGCYRHTRPGGHVPGWVWVTPAAIQVRNTVPLLEEDWTCTITSLDDAYDYFEFDIEGSKTGFDGHGNSHEDFTSNSGRVIIAQGDADDGGDWHLKRSHSISQMNTAVGHKIIWKVDKFAIDTLLPEASVPELENTLTLFKGVANAPHQLMLVRRPGAAEVVESVRVYRPYWGRQQSLHMQPAADSLRFDQPGGMLNLPVGANTIYTIAPLDGWLTINASLVSDSTTLRVYATANNSGSVRTSGIVFAGAGVGTDTVWVYQNAPVTSLTDIGSHAISFVPNPVVNNEFSIVGLLPGQVSLLTVFNMEGRAMVSCSIQNSGSNPRVSLPVGMQGLFVVHVRNAQGSFSRLLSVK